MEKTQKQKEFIVFLKRVKKYFKNPKRKIRLAAEDWDSNFKVLISTILSAQTLDTTTIKVCDKLFEKYDTPKKLKNAKYDDVLKIIKSSNYSKTKARNIILTSNTLFEKYDSKVPNKLDELLKLNGVGIKTANLVLGECFKIPAICVDTHVHRICNLFDFVKTKSADDTLKELEILVPKRYWIDINKYIVRLGQNVKGYDKEKFLELLKNN